MHSHVKTQDSLRKQPKDDTFSIISQGEVRFSSILEIRFRLQTKGNELKIRYFANDQQMKSQAFQLNTLIF